MKMAMLVHERLLPALRLIPSLIVAVSCQTDAVRVRVREGDTLSAIARRYGSSCQVIGRYNRLRDPHCLKVGQIIGIPPCKGVPMASGYRSPLSCRGVIWPAKGRLTSRFGLRYGHFHKGVDIAAPLGTPLYACQSGVVEFSGWKRGYGKTVIIRHEGYKTLYAHCHLIKVRKGGSVRKGQKIALMGVTGNARGSHLHFEYRDLADRPRNPLLLLPGR